MDLPSAFIHPYVQLTPDFCENHLSLITSHSHWWERVPTLAFGDGQTQDTALRRFGTDSSHVCTQSAGGGCAGLGGCTWELSEHRTQALWLCPNEAVERLSFPGRRWWGCLNNSTGEWGTELQDSGTSRNRPQSSLEDGCLTRWPSLQGRMRMGPCSPVTQGTWFQTYGQHVALGRI